MEFLIRWSRVRVLVSPPSKSDTYGKYFPLELLKIPLCVQFGRTSKINPPPCLNSSSYTPVLSPRSENCDEAHQLPTMCVQVVKDPMWSIPVFVPPSHPLRFDTSDWSGCSWGPVDVVPRYFLDSEWSCRSVLSESRFGRKRLANHLSPSISLIVKFGEISVFFTFSFSFSITRESKKPSNPNLRQFDSYENFTSKFLQQFTLIQINLTQSVKKVLAYRKFGTFAAYFARSQPWKVTFDL